MRRFSHVIFGCIAATLAASAVGCDWMPGRQEQLRKDVLAADPSFAQVLEKRDELANLVALMKQELELKRTQIERQITQLRQELSGATAQVNEKIRSTKFKVLAYAEYLTGERERLDRALATAEQELREKVEQIAGVPVTA